MKLKDCIVEDGSGSERDSFGSRMRATRQKEPVQPSGSKVPTHNPENKDVTLGNERATQQKSALQITSHALNGEIKELIAALESMRSSDHQHLLGKQCSRAQATLQELGKIISSIAK